MQFSTILAALGFTSAAYAAAVDVEARDFDKYVPDLHDVTVCPL